MDVIELPDFELAPEDVRRWNIMVPFDFLSRRADVAADMFDRDEYSIDGITLATVAMTGLATFRYANRQIPKSGGDQQRFRLLLTEHCPSFQNRVAIPELARRARQEHPLFESIILARFPIEGNFRVRQLAEDPLLQEFEDWAQSLEPPIPKTLRSNDYAGCIWRLYRNSVLHELRVASGREAGYNRAKPDAPPFFYSNHSGIEVSPRHIRVFVHGADPVEYIRFGVRPIHILTLLREAIASVREWALANDHDIFSSS